jgi:hypothetical protein
VSTTKEPEKTNLLATIVSNYLLPIMGGVLLALQGFNMHNTGEAARESGEIQQATKLEIQETSQELKEIRELHAQQIVILNELAKNDTTAKGILKQIIAALDEIKKVNSEGDADINQRQKEILDEIKELNKPDPIPSPSPPP